jgi:hypothetical protein
MKYLRSRLYICLVVSGTMVMVVKAQVYVFALSFARDDREYKNSLYKVTYRLGCCLYDLGY